MKRTTIKCEKCERKISASNFNRHFFTCKGKINTLHINEAWKQKNGKYKCPYCEKEYNRMGIISHIMRSHTNPEIWKNSGWNNRNIKHVSWNKGLTKETDDRVKQTGQCYSKNIKTGITTPSFLGKHHTKETKEQIGDKLSRNNKGGRCKWYEVIKPNGKTETVQGTWERDFVKVLNILDENWIKPGVGNKNHTYEWLDKEGKKHNYTPDFYSPKLNKYFEVKGYWWGEDKLKMKYVLEQHKLNVEIIQKKELESYLKLIT